VLTLIVVWLLLHRQCSAAIGPNVRRYVLFACPDLWEGMVWFLPTRRITIFSFWLLNDPAATISLFLINNLP